MTKTQRKLWRRFWCLVRRLGWSDEERLAILSERYGVESCKDLSNPQLEDAVRWMLYALGDVSTYRPAVTSGGASIRQIGLIEQLSEGLGGTPEGLSNLVARIGNGATDLAGLNGKEAGALIGVLQRLSRQRDHVTAGAPR